MRHPQAHRLVGPRSSDFPSPHPVLPILLFFLLRHLLLILLFDLSNSCGTMVRILLESSSSTSADTPPNCSSPSSSRFRPLSLSPKLFVVVFSTSSLSILISRMIASCSAITPSSARALSTWLTREDWVSCSWIWSSVRVGAGGNVG